MKIDYIKHTLIFRRPAGTSRSILKENTVWIIRLMEEGKVGYGECNPLEGLSLDYSKDFELILNSMITDFDNSGKIDLESLNDYPAIKFGFESALLDLKTEGSMILFPSEFVKGNASIAINGLLWMGSKEYMLEQLNEKIKLGFTCIKLKVGAIDFDQEVEVLKEIRNNFSADEIEIRLDANGAFNADTALKKLNVLAKYNIHSIEQAIAVGQWKEMKNLIKESPIAIALDEELIPIRKKEERVELLNSINPAYIILKPSLLGGFADCDEWISIAEQMDIKWWLTSALESNVGLNAIAQYAFSKAIVLPQGLGTGELYSNNFPSPLFISKGNLFYNSSKNWDIF